MSKNRAPIDTGTPPPSVQRQREWEASLLSSTVSAPATVTPVVEVKEDSEGTSIPRLEKPKRAVPKVKVTLDGELFSFDFMALDVAETDLAILFMVDDDEFTVKPKQETKFKLSYSNREFTVYYVSSPFKFPSQQANVLLFIKDQTYD